MMIKKVSAMFLAMSLCMGVLCTPVYAFAKEDSQDTEVKEEIKGTEPEESKSDEQETKKGSPLTPEGNLSLVDDVGSPSKNGKQFITAVTKNGNYFYIIIDRDDKGKETVHFLNQVDEADLLKLMDEKEASQIIQQNEKPVEPEKPEVTEPKPEAVEPAPVEKKKPNVLPLVALLAVVLGGGCFGLVKYKKKQKEKEASKPDPDADYVDDDDDYGYEEEDDEEEASDYNEEEEENELV